MSYRSVYRTLAAACVAVATLLATIQAHAGHGCGRCGPRLVRGPSDCCPAVPGMLVPDAENGLADAPPPPVGLVEDFAALTGGTTVQSFAGAYIDNAIVGDQLRFRFDAAYGNRKPDRAEFFYPGLPTGDGLLQPESRIDYQEYVGYIEVGLFPRLSAFLETPFRSINPEINENEHGFSDLATGVKYSLYSTHDRQLTLQFKVYTPTGDAERGLGTGQVSLEPGILYFQQLSPRLSFFGELRDWIPLGDRRVGNERFAGNVLRYGLGTGYDLWCSPDPCRDTRFTAVAEFVGWTVLGGQATVLENTQPVILDASGDTIVNVKVGGRLTSGMHSVMASYGHAMTREAWYEDILRVEYRLAY